MFLLVSSVENSRPGQPVTLCLLILVKFQNINSIAFNLETLFRILCSNHFIEQFRNLRTRSKNNSLFRV